MDIFLRGSRKEEKKQQVPLNFAALEKNVLGLAKRGVVRCLTLAETPSVSTLADKGLCVLCFPNPAEAEMWGAGCPQTK